MKMIVAAALGALTLQGPAMPAYDASEKSIPELGDALDRGLVTSHVLVKDALDRIAAYDKAGPAINALIAINPQALADADAMDAERRAGRRRGPLHGIPVVVKDNFDTADMPTTAASIALRGSRPDRDAFQVRRLREAGAVIVGKTNLHEFARGITTVSSLGGQTLNPYDLTRNPGGSSGGTGAAVAADFAAAGLGTDTCGSIRYPAAHNNLVGLRPTLGLSSRHGIVPLAHSQDVGGPLARSVVDVAIVLDVTAGSDPEDPTTRDADAHKPASYRAALGTASLQGVRIGVLQPLFGREPEDLRAGSVVRGALAALQKRGATLVDIDESGDVPSEQDGVSIIRFEFASDLNAYLNATPSAPVRTHDEILERHLVLPSLEAVFRRDAATTDSDEYRAIVQKHAQQRSALVALMDARQLRTLAYPTLRRTAAKIGEPQTGGNCAASAATGLPAITVPAGFADDGMPVGVELLGRPYAEPDLLSLAYAVEQATRARRPPVFVKKGWN